jgi:hypothetical protein
MPVIQAAEVKYVRCINGCTRTDNLKNGDMRNELLYTKSITEY